MYSGKAKGKGRKGAQQQVALAPVLVEDIWAQCDNPDCKKWRKLLPGSAPPQDDVEWFCSMNTDPLRASCSAPEESYDKDWEARQAEAQALMESLRQAGQAPGGGMAAPFSMYSSGLAGYGARGAAPGGGEQQQRKRRRGKPELPFKYFPTHEDELAALEVAFQYIMDNGGLYDDEAVTREAAAASAAKSAATSADTAAAAAAAAEARAAAPAPPHALLALPLWLWNGLQVYAPDAAEVACTAVDLVTACLSVVGPGLAPGAAEHRRRAAAERRARRQEQEQGQQQGKKRKGEGQLEQQQQEQQQQQDQQQPDQQQQETQQQQQEPPLPSGEQQQQGGGDGGEQQPEQDQQQQPREGKDQPSPEQQQQEQQQDEEEEFAAATAEQESLHFQRLKFAQLALLAAAAGAMHQLQLIKRRHNGHVPLPPQEPVGLARGRGRGRGGARGGGRGRGGRPPLNRASVGSAGASPAPGGTPGPYGDPGAGAGEAPTPGELLPPAPLANDAPPAPAPASVLKAPGDATPLQGAPAALF